MILELLKGPTLVSKPSSSKRKIRWYHRCQWDVEGKILASEGKNWEEQASVPPKERGFGGSNGGDES